MTIDELVALIERFDPAAGPGGPVSTTGPTWPASVWTTGEGFDRLRALLGEHGWRKDERFSPPASLTALEVPIYLDEDLEPGVIEFRDRAGAVLERATLPAVGA